MALFFPLKRIPTHQKKIYLSFDDGPCSFFTPLLMKYLKGKNIPATFFVIAQKAMRESHLIQQMIAEGHAIGDHSLDHEYRHYFTSRKKTKEWVMTSQQIHLTHFQKKSVGFRSPAGVWTPKLASVLKELEVPWIHWDTRFFDTQRTLTLKQMDKKLKKLQPGSIILLHDFQKKERIEPFLKSLDYFITKAQAMGFAFEKIEGMG